MEVAWIKKKRKQKTLELYVCHQKLGIRVEINTKQNKDKKKALAIGQMILYTTQKFN